MNWSKSFAASTKSMKPSVIREILKLTQRSSVISFAGGLPAPQLFPVERLCEAAETVLTQHGSEALQYGALDVSESGETLTAFAVHRKLTLMQDAEEVR